MNRRRQAGAALLMAMLTVTLVATFAAAALWQQWRSIEVETAERARVQSGWILTGALDWARLLLREDARPNGSTVDHLGEPWAVPLQEARLSSFLAADKGSATVDLGPEVMDAFLSGQVIDLQSMMNLTNMIDPKGTPLPDQVESFANLFRLLGLPGPELERLKENLRFAVASTATKQPSAQAPLPPQKVEQLLWLGISAQTIATLQPYVTFLESRTPVNVNTAGAEVIAAAAGVDLSQAQALVQRREKAHFKTADEAYNILGSVVGSASRSQGVGLDVKSSFFEVRARLRLDQLLVEERAVLRRDGVEVRVVQRERGIPDPTAMAQLAAGKR